jgi:hypothetical protein
LSRRGPYTCHLSASALAAIAFRTTNNPVEAAAGPVAVGPVGMELVAVGAVAVGLVAVVVGAAPAGQPLERGPGGLPVAAPARRLPARVGAEQPLRVDLVPLTGVVSSSSSCPKGAVPFRPAGS